MIVSPFRSQTPVRNFSPREAYAVLVDLCSCTDDTREQKKEEENDAGSSTAASLAHVSPSGPDPS